MAEGDQSGWYDLTHAATPAAWGQAIDVPDIILYLTCISSSVSVETGARGEYAAKILTPGRLYLAELYLTTESA